MTMRNSRPALALLTGMAACAVPTSIYAQEAERYNFDLPAQDLGDALLSVAAKAGWELYAPAEDLTGISSPQLRGKYTVEQAIERLLRGTNLVARFDDRAVIIRGRSTAATASEQQSSEAIIVTGTRIEGAPPAAPVIRISSEDIRNAGQSDLGEVARSLPQNFGGGQNPGVGSGQGNFNENVNVNGASTFNLRGVGSNATLTLLNGNRFSYTGTSSVVDVSAIPVSAVERVEIVADGASAIYGADAVAGVVNILLRKDYEGVSTSGRIGGSTDGGNFQQQYNILGGAKWSSGGFLATYDYFENDAIFAGDRAYTRANNPDSSSYPALHRHSLLLSGHQELSSSLNFQADIIYKRGAMRSVRGIFVDRPISARGLDVHTKFESFGVAPVMEVELGGDWRARIAGFYGTDTTDGVTRSFTNGVETPIYRRYANRNLALEAGLQGPIVELPAGDLRLAIGGGVRGNRFTVAVAGTNYAASRKNSFAYGEVFVPLASPAQNIAFLHRASLTAAVRWEDYSDSGSIVIPKLGVLYEPAEELTLGLSWGRSFKMPTLKQQYDGYSAVLLPIVGYGDQFPAGTNYLYLVGSDPDMKPERSENWTFSATFRPSARLEIVTSFFRIDYRGRVAPPFGSPIGVLTNPLYADLMTNNPSAAMLEGLIAGASEPLQNATSGSYSPANVIVLVDGRDRNIARQRYEGVDLSLRYHAPLGGGRSLTATASASWLDSRQTLLPGLPTTDLSGNIFNPPHFRARGGVSYDSENFTLSSFINYAGGVTDRRRAVPAEISPVATFDLTGRYRLGDLAEISISALNLFNAKPDAIYVASAGDTAFDSTNYSPVGRFVGVTIRRDW
ncbi:TonB-dependent receptor [Sphingopyxis sp. GW247-27LB]|uniref:TonB-dependent receptor domain-containing protein n=1 Tax=Sphingopyxis sp. GW247-27LB TaxID=2012632 RepID=UPI000BA4F6B2|nr:TonB-dependent receptor [Sphingopyxis sp. GW247-27LB]PAL24335.1 TonB-dependent receptor [Sphingopyxis sp. GW247-27LB]